MPLPYKLLGPGANMASQRSCPGWSQEEDVRTIVGPATAKGQLCPLPSVLAVRILAHWPPKQGKGQDILEEAFLSFLICPLGTAGATLGSSAGGDVAKAFKKQTGSFPG